MCIVHAIFFKCTLYAVRVWLEGQRSKLKKCNTHFLTSWATNASEWKSDF